MSQEVLPDEQLDQSVVERIIGHVPPSMRAYLPILPVLSIVGLFIFFPILNAIYTGFFTKSLLQPNQQTLVGVSNYQQIVANADIHTVLINTGIWVAAGSLISVVIGFLMGWVMHNKLPYESVASGLVLIPWILPRVVGASIWAFMFNGSQGIINELLLRLGIIEEYIVMLGEPALSLYPPLIGMIWRLAPLFALLVLTSLKSIDERQYEAAEIDGATPWEVLRYITLPRLKYPLAIGFLLMLIYDIRNFAMIWAMTKGGPLLSSTTLPVMVYRTAFTNYNLGLASALSTLLFLILLVFSYFYIRIYDNVQENFS